MKIFKENLNCKSARAVKVSGPDFSASSWLKKQTHFQITQKVLKRKRACRYGRKKTAIFPPERKTRQTRYFSKKGQNKPILLTIHANHGFVNPFLIKNQLKTRNCLTK